MNWHDFISEYRSDLFDYGFFMLAFIAGRIRLYRMDPVLYAERSRMLMGHFIGVILVLGFCGIEPLLMAHDLAFFSLVFAGAITGYFLFQEPIARVDEDRLTIVFKRKRASIGKSHRYWRLLSEMVIFCISAVAVRFFFKIACHYFPGSGFHQNEVVLWWWVSGIVSGLYLGYFLWLAREFYRKRA